MLFEYVPPAPPAPEREPATAELAPPPPPITSIVLLALFQSLGTTYVVPEVIKTFTVVDPDGRDVMPVEFVIPVPAERPVVASPVKP